MSPATTGEPEGLPQFRINFHPLPYDCLISANCMGVIIDATPKLSRALLRHKCYFVFFAIAVVRKLWSEPWPLQLALALERSTDGHERDE